MPSLHEVSAPELGLHPHQRACTGTLPHAVPPKEYRDQSLPLPAGTHRHPQFPLWFSVACLLGGCVIFAGALHAHQDLYTYNVAKEAEERRKNPSEAQRRIAAMLMERRAQTLGGGGGSSGGLVGAAAGGEQAYSDRPR